MDDSELERIPNPFSAFAESRDQSKRHFFATVKYLLIAIVLFTVVTVGQVYLHRARLAKLLNGFSSGTTADKLEQLQQLQSSGVDGLPGIVAAVADEKLEVSAAATEMLVDWNRQWITLPAQQMAEARFVFADQLALVSTKVLDPTDPRFDRIQDLARLAARDLIDSGCSEDDTTYLRLMEVIAIEPSSQVSASPENVADESPLPIELVENAGASWTDWPPTSTTPTLYRREVATLDSMDSSAVILQQPTGGDRSGGGDARLLKPKFHPAATLVEQSNRPRPLEVESTSYWVTQLKSGSPLVRMGAVTELARSGSRQGTEALEAQLRIEPDFKIRQQIENHLTH